MVETFFTSPLFVDYILPFLLVFTIIFAILEKTKLLGDQKKAIDSIVGIVIGLLLVSFDSSRKIVVELMPILAVLVIILLVFMVIYGFSIGGEVKLNTPGAKTAVITIVLIVLAISLLTITGYMEKVRSFMSGEKAGSFIFNFIFIVIIIGAIIAVVKSGGK